MKKGAIISFVLAIFIIFQFTSCSFLDSATDKAKDIGGKVKDAAIDVGCKIKNTVVDWYNEIDFEQFKEGWNAATDYIGSAYTAVVTSQYIADVSNAINDLKVSINSAAGSARGIAQEAGFAAEKWVAGTFNIDAIAKGSDNRASVLGSTEHGSADVVTNYGEQASLKYYQEASGSNSSAAAQATTQLEAYHSYLSSTKSDNPMTLSEYMDKHGFDPNNQSDLLASVYYGQTRLIPYEQLPEATAYLQGRINKLSALSGPVPEGRLHSVQETLDSLKGRLESPDGVSSKEITYEEMQAIAELSQKGEFKPEDFGVSLSTAIPPKYVIKEALGTGLDAGLIKMIFTVAPDVYSIICESIKDGSISEEALKETGITGAIAFGEGFVEGSISRIIISLCQSGKFGAALAKVPANVIGCFTYLIIEAAIAGYSLATGEITAEEYGALMINKTFVSALALPTTALFLSVLPSAKIFVVIGCVAGGIVASAGYSLAKEVVLEFVDGGGMEAVIPAGIGDSINSIKKKVSGLNIKEKLSDFKDAVVSTANNGYVIIKSALGD